jgi:hypothetical protein
MMYCCAHLSLLSSVDDVFKWGATWLMPSKMVTGDVSTLCHKRVPVHAVSAELSSRAHYSRSIVRVLRSHTEVKTFELHQKA